MLEAAVARARQLEGGRLQVVQAAMTQLPFADRVFDLVIAHGIWNLATSDDAFRHAVREATRVSRPGAALFVFTFSRHTLAADAAPLPGQTLTYNQFSGTPQTFVTATQLTDELRAAGFEPDDRLPLTEHNRRARATLASTSPVIYEGAFRRLA
jgi:ubiquinone/menaquinone biosynthesis C-methylase UbiE